MTLPLVLGLAAAGLATSTWATVDPAACWPVSPATVVRAFDDPATYAPGHRGVDLLADPGQPVHAALAGTVRVARTVVGRPLVVLEHEGGVRTTYLPVTPLVRPGQQVAAGETLGVLSAVAHCTPSCLHWGARLDERYVDPRTLLTGRGLRVVLLPGPPS